MASLRTLKKDINNVLGDIIDAVYVWEGIHPKKSRTESEAIIDDAIATFDDLIIKVNKKDVENRKIHLREVRIELEEKATKLIERVNNL